LTFYKNCSIINIESQKRSIRIIVNTPVFQTGNIGALPIYSSKVLNYLNKYFTFNWWIV